MSVSKEALAQLSHEMSNHLTQIILASNLLKLDLEQTLSGEQQHQFKGIDEGAQQIRALLMRLKRLTDAESELLRSDPNREMIAPRTI
jgi:K+-sensing histidine kinase KdpD